MKVISAITTVSPMKEGEIDTFYESKLNLQLSSIGNKGDPNTQPVWFIHG